MRTKIYRVINHINGHWMQVAALSAQEACQMQGWLIGDCLILELPLRPGTGKQALTQDELDYLADCKVRWGTTLTAIEAAECHRILEKWLTNQTWDHRDHKPLTSPL